MIELLRAASDLIVRHSGKLDWEYVDEQLRPLAELKEVPEILVELEMRRREYEA